MAMAVNGCDGEVRPAAEKVGSHRSHSPKSQIGFDTCRESVRKWFIVKTFSLCRAPIRRKLRGRHFAPFPLNPFILS